MAFRLTGLTNRLGLGRPVAAVRSLPRLHKVAFSSVLLLVILAACSSTATYPVDLYSAMHYQKSFRTLEPPRFLAPESAVPITGRDPVYTTQQITQLENPIPADEASIARGQQVYDVNCAVCHGDQGQGNGPMAPFLQNAGANPPANLTADRLQQVPDSHFYNIVTNGLGQYMPAFPNLIPGEDMWHLVNYIRSLQGQVQ